MRVPAEALSALNEAREQLFEVSGSALLAGEKAKTDDRYACYHLVCSANNGIAYALSLLSASPPPTTPDQDAVEARRYRWLRGDSQTFLEPHPAIYIDDENTLRGDALDAAIDAAMSKEPK